MIPEPIRRKLAPMAVLIIGLMSIGLHSTVREVANRQTLQHLRLERSLDRLELALVRSHLWLEEWLSGDLQVDLETEVWGNLTEAMDASRAIMRGGEVPGVGLLRAAEGEEILREAEALQEQLIAFRVLSEERFERREVAGSDMDQRYDAAFREVMVASAAVRTQVDLRQGRVEKRTNRLLLSVLVVWAGLVISAWAGLMTLERRQRDAEAELRSREVELLQAQKLEAVGRLAGGIAHDVSNYLGAIRGYCEVAVMKNESGEALKSRMEAAIDTCHRISSMIRQLLAFSRREALQIEVLDLNRLVGGMEPLVQRLLGDDIHLEFKVISNLWAVEADPSQVEQTVVNLLVNARDAMPQGGVIKVELANIEVSEQEVARFPEGRAGRFVQLSVHDTGSGIPESVRGRIFEPFFTTKDASDQHSGLGLATVYGVMHQNGGFVAVDSREGEGTSFHLFFSASETTDAPATPPEESPITVATSCHVLLVEDNPAMRESTRALLEALGHEVVVAEHGEAALVHFENDDRFDLLITDVIMPRISGKEVFDRLRQRRPDLRCLFISGYTDNVTLRHGLDQERVHFLEKPFGAKALNRKIREVMGSSPAL